MQNGLSKKEILEQAQRLATPINFEALIDQGILGDKKGAWYPVLDMDRLPEHAKAQMEAFDTDGSRAKFSKSNKRAQKIVDNLS